jgi:Kef-type K+ transport system membrane component KefB
MENIWLHSALWIGLALIASLVSMRIGISVALVEIVIGAFAGNLFVLSATPWINYLAGVGAILLAFLAGAEIDPAVIKKHFWSSTSIAVAGFLLPFWESSPSPFSPHFIS